MKKQEKAYGLKTVNKDMTSHNGFKWPKEGHVVCKDWNTKPECGGGLHFALNGEGNGLLFKWEADAVWIVAEFDKKSIVDLRGKVKVPSCKVLYAGTREEATKILYELCGKVACIGGHSTSGDHGQSTSGDCGQSTSGDCGQSTSGDCGQSTSGDHGQSTSGDHGQSTSGDLGQSTSGDHGQSTSGDWGQSTSGDWGQSTSGDKGQSTSGYNGHSTSCYGGQSTSGDLGQSTSGDCGQSVGRNAKKLKTGRFGASMNRGHSCRWFCAKDSVIFLHWDEKEKIRFVIFQANDYPNNIGKIAVIKNGNIVGWEDEV